MVSGNPNVRLVCSEEPVNGPYPRPGESSPCLSIIFRKGPF